MSLYATPSQTVGPYLHIGLTWLNTDNLAGPDVKGERVTIEGRVFAGDGKPVNDAMIEIWQANAQGRYAHPDDKQDKPLEPGFKGFGRIPTDDEGRFRFVTIKPGRVPGSGGEAQAPHLAVSVFARGVIKRLATRMYFPDEPSNASDPILKLVPAERRATLIAKKTGGRDGVLEWNVVIQGDNETVFFDV
jgi:protocatechuate 3,4-dioxygenase, alpha subunit